MRKDWGVIVNDPSKKEITLEEAFVMAFEQRQRNNEPHYRCSICGVLMYENIDGCYSCGKNQVVCIYDP